MQTTKWFSILVAADHSDRCEQLKANIIKQNKFNNSAVNSLFKDVDDKFFASDIKKNKIIDKNILQFRRILESAMTDGKWFGQAGYKA